MCIYSTHLTLLSKVKKQFSLYFTFAQGGLGVLNINNAKGFKYNENFLQIL